MTVPAPGGGVATRASLRPPRLPSLRGALREHRPPGPAPIIMPAPKLPKGKRGCYGISRPCARRVVVACCHVSSARAAVSSTARTPSSPIRIILRIGAVPACRPGRRRSVLATATSRDIGATSRDLTALARVGLSGSVGRALSERSIGALLGL